MKYFLLLLFPALLLTGCAAEHPAPTTDASVPPPDMQAGSIRSDKDQTVFPKLAGRCLLMPAEHWDFGVNLSVHGS